MYPLSIMVSSHELVALKAGKVPVRLFDALSLEAIKVSPSQEVEIHATADGMAIYWQGTRVGVAHKYLKEGREFWQLNYAPDYKRSIRRTTLAKLVDAINATYHKTKQDG